MQQCAARIHRLFAVHQQRGGADIHKQADDGNQRHRFAVNHRWLEQPAHGGDRDADDDQGHEKHVAQRRQSLDAPQSIGMLARGGALCQFGGDGGQSQRSAVGQHVAGIAQQRE